MAAANKKPSSLADNPPVELYGPEDGGWYTTRVYDWIPLCPRLRDPDVRGYLILRSLVIEKYKNPIRKLTLMDLCELIPSPTEGQPSSLTRVRGILDALSKVHLICTPEGGPVRTSSRASASGKPIRIRVNDMPPEGYAGWRNTEDKLSHVARLREEQEAGRKSDPGPDAGAPEKGVGRKSDPAGRKSDPRGQKSDPDPDGDLQEPELPLVPSVGTASGGDALSARSAADARRASDGSSVREAEGGFAASSNNHPSPQPEVPHPQAKASSRTKHTREQLDLVRAVRAHYPPDLLAAPLPDVWELSQAILDALAGDVPAADRTVEQLGARIQQRWNHHGWGEKFYTGQIQSLVGAAVAMVRPLKATDRYGCANPRCEAGADVDTAAPCQVCPKRLEDRKQTRSQPQGVPAPREAAPPMPASAARPHRECACRNPIPKGSDDTMCRDCRKAEQAMREMAAQGPAPF
ncbi:hypothetical protein [Streptomyces caniscabiei]|uniref:hypothetical protein n=1 Tax=Streptomyces caniscabiei TaxID=2746961 RepID=UPI00187226BD|nr:hypothetical protein [Streptomyces caniscabiei]MBE4761715.1 hypothetical protein [Streptomyces caniscabiei]MDX2947957.1 hypothetical protein [Streptomyces caniscabiei]